LVRATPVFPAVGIFAVLLLEGLMWHDRRTLLAGALVVLGGVCTLVMETLPYALVGEMDMLARSLLLAPVAYVQERGHSSFLKEIATFATSKSIGGAFFFGLVGMASHFITQPKSPAAWRIAVMWLSLTLGLARAPEGAFYLILLMPFACIFAAPAFSKLTLISKFKLVAIALTIALLLPVPIAAFTAIKRGNVRSPTSETFAILSKEIQPGDTLYATTDYLLYWLMDRAPPHPIVTHAGNLFRPGMLSVLPFGMSTSADVMRSIVATPPTWIILGAPPNRYGPETDVGEVLQPVIASKYELFPSPSGRLIYRLRSPFR
jgi:hypothetical protein